MRTAVILLALATAVCAADEEKSNIRIDVTADMGVADFLELVARTTGKPLLYDPNSQRIRNQKFGVTLSLEVPKAKLFDTYRALLAFYELTMVPVGPRGYETFLVLDSRTTNNFVKNKATFVEATALESFADKDGMYVSSFVPIQHLENTTVVRTALSTMVSPAGIGRVHEVPGAGIVLMDFAPTVAAMARIIRFMDVPQSSAWMLESFELTHANAKEVADSVQELYLDADDGPPESRGRRAPVRMTPRLVPYRSRNAVLVRATRREMETIRGLVAKLDQEANQRRAHEIVRLNHVEAAYLASVLNATLAGPATDDWPIAVVAEHHTQSVLLNGDRNAIAAVKELIKQIDVEKPK